MVEDLSLYLKGTESLKEIIFLIYLQINLNLACEGENKVTLGSENL